MTSPDFGSTSDLVGISLLLGALALIVAGDLHPSTAPEQRRRAYWELALATGAVVVIILRFVVMI